MITCHMLLFLCLYLGPFRRLSMTAAASAASSESSDVSDLVNLFISFDRYGNNLGFRNPLSEPFS